LFPAFLEKSGTSCHGFCFPACRLPAGRQGRQVLLHPRQNCNGSCTRTPAFAEATAVKARICTQLRSCTVINYCLRDSLYPRHSLLSHGAGATLVMLKKFVPMTLACGSVRAGLDGKNSCHTLPACRQAGLHPMTFASLSQGLRRDSFSAKVPGPCPVLSSGNMPPRQSGSFAIPT
jgi:hypothetical protein